MQSISDEWMDKYTHCRGVQSPAKLGKIPRKKSRWRNNCGRALVDLKGPKGGMSDGLFPLLGLAEIDIYLLRGFFPQQKYTSSDQSLSWLVLNWLLVWDLGKQKSDTQELVDGSRVVPGVLPQPPSCWHPSATARWRRGLNCSQTRNPSSIFSTGGEFAHVLPNSSLVSCTFCLHSPSLAGYVSLCAVGQLHLSSEAHASGKEF